MLFYDTIELWPVSSIEKTVDTNEQVNVKLTKSENRGAIAAWKTMSLRRQQLVTASFAAISSAITVLVVFILEGQIIPQNGNLLSGQAIQVGLAALAGAIAAGIATFTLEEITLNRLNRSQENLQKFFDNWFSGNESEPEVELDPEWEELAVNVHRMKEAIAELQQTLEITTTEKEELQQQLIELVNREDVKEKLEIDTEGQVREEGKRSLNLPGTILEFIEQLNTREEEFDPDLFIGSSTPAEIQQRYNLLEYRELWLEALLAETKVELEVIREINQANSKLTNAR